MPIDEITSAPPVAKYASNCPASPMPMAASSVPTGIIQLARMRSEKAPSSGCRNDEPTLEKSSSAPAAA